MFCLLNFAEAPLVENIVPNFEFAQLAEWGIVGIVAVIGGLIADVAGRKRIVIAGFVMLGIEYAAMSAFSDFPAFTFYLFLILDGISWGLLASAFFTTIWGDLGENQEKEKYYVLGGLPYLLSNFMYVLIKTYASGLSTGAAFSFASFFLFLAVLPLMYAPETLPEKTIKAREMQSYLEKAQKEAEKYA
jgi:MFS family permease